MFLHKSLQVLFLQLSPTPCMRAYVFAPQLLKELATTSAEEERALALCDLYYENIAPLEPAIWEPEYDDREAAIRELSCQLDRLEVAATGPMLAGRQISRADGLLFPSMCVLWHTLPRHFGWLPWTEEAIFYKRPRLHAWWELMQFEDPAAKVAEELLSDVEALSIDWGVPVPTSHIRTLPKHAP
eukprot:6214515-Pleurochrysis_carterae.AAC.2